MRNLGAFALESWKDNRHEEKELLEVYRTIADDLQTDVLALDTLLNDYEWRINILMRILTEPVSMDDLLYDNIKYLDFII